MVKYKIADIIFNAKPLYQYTFDVCAKYLYDGDQPAEFDLVITNQDIEREKAGLDNCPNSYAESLAVYRKLIDYMHKTGKGMLFHCSALMVDNNAYLFTAPSGTGKSTHAKLWRQLLGDKVVMINDDKPIVRQLDDGFYVYGTPWNGKHGLDTNCRAKIKAICQIYQSTDNQIKTLSPKEMLFTLLRQTVVPIEEEQMQTFLKFVDQLLNGVDLYLLGCNISVDAAKLAYFTMSKETKNED